MRLDEAINYLNELMREDNYKRDPYKKQHARLKKWLLELKELRKIRKRLSHETR